MPARQFLPQLPDRSLPWTKTKDIKRNSLYWQLQKCSLEIIFERPTWETDVIFKPLKIQITIPLVIGQIFLNHSYLCYFSTYSPSYSSCRSAAYCSHHFLTLDNAYLRIQEVSMNNCTFNIIEIRVVFQSSLEQACLFTQLGNMGTIIVCKHLVSENGICNLGGYISYSDCQKNYSSLVYKLLRSHNNDLLSKLSGYWTTYRQQYQTSCSYASPVLSLPFWRNWVIPVGHESNSFPGDGSEGGLLQGGCFSGHPTKRMCTAAEDCAPWTHPQSVDIGQS